MGKPLPPMVLQNGQIVADLLNQSRSIRQRAMRVFHKLEEESIRETGVGYLQTWASHPDNYKDFLSFVTRVMPKEPELAHTGSVEDLLEELDKRSREAKIVQGEADYAVENRQEQKNSVEEHTGAPQGEDVCEDPD